MRLHRDRFYFALSLATFAVSFVLYLITRAPTLSFWDCGEFIASSYILGIPHPPGYPLFVLIGRIFTMLPIASSIAVRVNLISVLGGAASAFMAYWLILRIILGRGYMPSPLAKTGIGVGALCGSLVMAFSQTFWSNAVEAEVYTLSMFLMLVINYLALIWAQSEPENKNDGLLILIAYLSWLSLGIHMTTFIIVLPALLYLAYTDFMETGLRRWPVWGAMAIFMLYPVPIQIEIARLFGVDISPYEMESFMLIFAVAFAAIIGLTIYSRIKQSESFRAWWLATMVMTFAIIGYSTQVYIPIRASERPAINENNPSNWGRFKAFLERKQYGQESMITRMLTRRGTWKNQLISSPRFGFLGIFNAQYASPEAKLTIYEARKPENGRSAADFSVSLSMLYILIIGLYGIYELIRRSPPDGIFIVLTMLLCTVGLVIYMNFSDGSINIAPVPEVRNRDYFYTPGFMYYGILIGAGLAFILGRIGGRVESATLKRPMFFLFIAACLAAGGLATQTIAANFTHNNRSNNYLPLDYARNILDSCRGDGIIFTNGDNDTFPLWYAQEVEKFRTDVRVVNLSLLNTPWYIHQLKDLMGVPIKMSDGEIDSLRAFRISGSDMIYRVQDQMIQHIITNVISDGWNVPIYFAITVPGENRPGLEDHLIMEGLAYRLVASAEEDSVDTGVGVRIFTNPANFRGIADPSVHKDDNDRRLVMNYVVAMLQLADEFRARGEIDSAIVLARRAIELQPQDAPWQVSAYLASIYAGQGNLGEIKRLADASSQGENVYLAVSQEMIGKQQLDKAEEILKMAFSEYPFSLPILNNLGALYFQRGDSAAFDSLMDNFRNANIDDPRLIAIVDQMIRRLKQLPPSPDEQGSRN